jgi:hypothetical protein
MSFVSEVLQRSKREDGQTFALSIFERDEMFASGKVDGLEVLDELRAE